jgi:hypothetical protein
LICGEGHFAAFYFDPGIRTCLQTDEVPVLMRRRSPAKHNFLSAHGEDKVIADPRERLEIQALSKQVKERIASR